MSRSLHAWIEIGSRRLDGSWTYFSFAGPFLGNDDALLSLMEGDGVNSPYQMKGLPPDIAWQCLEDSTFRVSDEISELGVDSYCSRAEAEDWVRRGKSRYVRTDLVSDPDMHWDSWMDVFELEEVQRRYRMRTGAEYRPLGAVIAAMRVLDEAPSETSRLVFWFR
jgi:hypothetical protein